MTAPGDGPPRALVTGATRGIGRAVAQDLGERGFALILTGTDPDRLAATVREFRARGWTAEGLALRLEDAASRDSALATLARRIDRLDILVLNAALGGMRESITDYPDTLWRTLFEANVHATRSALALLFPLLESAPAGRILVMTTGVARNWKIRTGAYAASKAATDALVQIHALETAGGTVRTNLLNPGPTRTAMRAGAFPDEDPDDLKPAETLLPLVRQLLSPTEAPHGQRIDAEAHPLVQAEIARLPRPPRPRI